MGEENLPPPLPHSKSSQIVTRISWSLADACTTITALTDCVFVCGCGVCGLVSSVAKWPYIVFLIIGHLQR